MLKSESVWLVNLRALETPQLRNLGGFLPWFTGVWLPSDTLRRQMLAIPIVALTPVMHHLTYVAPIS